MSKQELIQSCLDLHRSGSSVSVLLDWAYESGRWQALQEVYGLNFPAPAKPVDYTIEDKVRDSALEG